MQVDKLTKTLLTFIAIALWMIAMNPWLRPLPVAAQEKVDLSQIESSLTSIAGDISTIKTDFGHIARGTCTNPKFC